MNRDKAEQKQLLNSVMNAPDVLPFVAPGFMVVDGSAFLDQPGCYIFGDDRGLVLFKKVDEGHEGFEGGVYEMHYLLTYRMRGAAGMRRIREAIADLFTKVDACAITGATPRDNFSARAVNRALGGRPCGTTIDSLGRDCIIYILERATWAHLSGAQ